MLLFITAYANPQRFEALAQRISPWIAGLTALSFVIGIYLALFASPEDYQQAQTVRIMYVHVPAAWMALFCYTSMAIASAVGFIWKHPLADVAAKSTAPIGATFTALALITGSLWGKPMWGTWWAWDARLTSVLLLFFMYLGIIALWRAIDDQARAARIAGIAAIVGVINIPIIKFSVDWWNSLHQPASVFRPDGPTMPADFLAPLGMMGLAYSFLYGWLLLIHMRAELAERRQARRGGDEAPVSTLKPV